MQASQVLGKNKCIAPCTLRVITLFLQQIDIGTNSKGEGIVMKNTCIEQKVLPRPGESAVQYRIDEYLCFSCFNFPKSHLVSAI